MRQNQTGFSITVVPVTVIIILIIGILGYRINKNQLSKSDLTYFSQLASTTQSFYERQAEALGVKASDEPLVKRCSQTGQGPFDDGHLACGVQITRKIQVVQNDDFINGLLNKFTVALKQDSFVIVGGNDTVGPYGVSFSAGRYNADPRCTTSIIHSVGSINADAKTFLEYTLECSKDAATVPTGFSYTPLR